MILIGPIISKVKIGHVKAEGGCASMRREIWYDLYCVVMIDARCTNTRRGRGNEGHYSHDARIRTKIKLVKASRLRWLCLHDTWHDPPGIIR